MPNFKNDKKHKTGITTFKCDNIGQIGFGGVDLSFCGITDNRINVEEPPNDDCNSFL